MSYTDNAPLITAWDTRVQALKDIIATLYDGTSHNVLIEDTGEANMLLSSMSVDSLTLDSNEQAPQITIEMPKLILNPEEGSDESDQEEEKEDTVDETVEEPSDQEDETVEEPSDEETDETEEEEEVTSEE